MNTNYMKSSSWANHEEDEEEDPERQEAALQRTAVMRDQSLLQQTTLSPSLKSQQKRRMNVSNTKRGKRL